MAPGFGFNNDSAFGGSLFYGAKIFDGLGGLAQVTYDNVPNRSVGTTRHPVRHTI
jgi:hypothetical protein